MDKSIIKRIQEGKFPFADNAAYGKPMDMANQEFTRCLDLVNRKVPDIHGDIMEAAFEIFDQLMLREEDNEEELSKLAVDTIRDLYEVPEHIVLVATVEDVLSANLDVDMSQDELNISPERMQELLPEIKKRVILNGLSHGSSIHIWKSAHHLVNEPLHELDHGLIDDHDKYAALIGISFWITPLMIAEQQLRAEDGSMFQQGLCKIEFEDGDVNIQANGVVFPVLLHELNKGVIDYLIMRGLPHDVTKDELRYIYQEADKYEDEIWHYLLSPSLWKKLLDGCQVSPNKIPEIISNLSILTYKELADIFSCDSIREKLKYYKVL